MATAIRSVHDTAKSPSDIRFHVIHKMSSAGQQRIADSVPEASIDFVYGGSKIESFSGGTGRIADLTSAAWLRAFSGDLLPAVDKAVYMDCDTICVSDIAELAAKDLKGRPVGAVTDFYSNFEAANLKGEWGARTFDGSEPYFNSGVLVCDLEQWRGLGVSYQVSVTARDFIHRFSFLDQDALNLVFANAWTDVCPSTLGSPEAWNNRRFSRLARLGHSNDEQVKELVDAKIVHYTTPFKPWREQYPSSLARNVYADFERRTTFAYEQPEPLRAAPGWRDGRWAPTPEELLAVKEARRQPLSRTMVEL